ncbi:hypothetical protein Acr_11g0000290 [Actinidia rufa]|uniref:CCHC-type domain-containing protein n=1 Tax=Actinidia rufa TaxID=165716 RepID=A0A7J0FAT2_9ERIC|nr:hypothetical protein Acr_11g0000290 [Actinidia rufa]
MDDTRGSGQEGGNDNPQMTELRNMVQMMVGAVTAQQQLLQQHFQPPQSQETRELDLSRGKTQQGKTSEYRGVTEDLAIPMGKCKCGRYHWGVYWKDIIEVRNEIRCFHCNEVGHIKRNCPRLRTEVVAPRGGPRGGNVRPAGNVRLGGNRPGNPGNRDGNVNNQR